jgi:hypothetical protein
MLLISQSHMRVEEELYDWSSGLGRTSEAKLK